MIAFGNNCKKNIEIKFEPARVVYILLQKHVDRAFSCFYFTLVMNLLIKVRQISALFGFKKIWIETVSETALLGFLELAVLRLTDNRIQKRSI